MRTLAITFILLLSFASTQLACAEAAKSEAKDKAEKTKSSKTEGAAEVAESDKPKIYLKLDPSLVVNVEEKDVTRFLQVDAQLQFSDPLAQAIIEKHMPAIRDAIIMVISGAEVPKIKTSQGKEDLRKATLQALQKVMTEITGEAVLEEIYFTGFIIQ